MKRSGTSQRSEAPVSPLFFISAGDPSGDVHAARLVEALSRNIPDARFIGYAGPKTAATCCDVRFDLTQFAAMMLKKAIVNLPNYIRLLNQVDTIFKTERPSVVILVDFPGFNWKVAQKAKKLGIPVVYFMPPQIWGWGQWRVKKMRKYVDLVLSCFHFEDSWFKNNNCQSTFISHPFFEEARSRKIDETFINSLNSQETGVSSSECVIEASNTTKRRYLTLLPGSRDQEVAHNLDGILTTLARVLQETPDVHPIFAAYKDSHAEIIKNVLKQRNLDYPVYAGKTPELMRVATCCFGVSGSVSIELLSLCKPTVITYRISKLEYYALRFLKRVKYITLTNLLYIDSLEGETPFYPKGFLPKSTEYTQKERNLMLFPEFLSYQDNSEQAAAHLIKWFKDDDLRRECVAKLEVLKMKNDAIVSPIERAAETIKAFLYR